VHQAVAQRQHAIHAGQVQAAALKWLHHVVQAADQAADQAAALKSLLAILAELHLATADVA